METALVGLVAVMCPLAMLGGMAWMVRRPGSRKRGAASTTVTGTSETAHA